MRVFARVKGVAVILPAKPVTVTPHSGVAIMIDDGHGFRRSLFLFLEGSWPWGRFFSVFILALVVLNLAMMIVTTVDSIYEPHAEIFDLIEVGWPVRAAPLR